MLVIALKPWLCEQIFRKQKENQFLETLVELKWTLPGSNQRPSDYESDALTD
jgi:hypothetical protein